MRVIVCGGRNYSGDAAANHVQSVLDAIHMGHIITTLIQGGAPGADFEAKLWAEMREVKCVTVPALWREHGRAAGPIRNKRMLTDFEPDVVVAFPGGKGTADMIKQAEAHGIEVLQYFNSNPERSREQTTVPGR